MAYLIAKLIPVEELTMKEADCGEPIVVLCKRRSNHPPLNPSEARPLLSDAGFELGPIFGRAPQTDWPLCALVYLSPRGPSGLHRIPARRIEDTNIPGAPPKG